MNAKRGLHYFYEKRRTKKSYFLCTVKVLILHQHYHTPENGGPLRSYYLAKALADFGFEPIVITAHTHPYKTEKTKGIEVHYLSVPYDNSYTFYKRGYAFLQYAWKAFFFAQKFRDAKICYAISVPLTVGLTAMWINRMYKIPYVFEVGDLWPDAPIEMGYIKNRLLKKILLHLETRVYQNANVIVALSESIKEAIRKKVAGKTIEVIPNMADTDFLRPATADVALKEKFGVRGKLVISYTGALGAANGLHHVVECARQSQYASLPIHFLICGEGAMKQDLTSRIKGFSLHNVSLIPFAKREGIREILNVSDAVFISYDTFLILETGSPHKYFDGLAAGKLILVNFSGWIRTEIEKYACGIFIDPQKQKDIVEKITPFLNDATLTKKYQVNARKLAEEQYTRRQLSKKFVDIIRANTQ